MHKSAKRFISANIPADRLLPGVHGLRGIAAIAVVLFHLVHLVKINPPDAFHFIAADFGKGVHLFFVISAFSLMHSTANTINCPDWLRIYFLKRFFRIAPLFYAIMAGMMLWPFLRHGAWGQNFETAILNLTFTFGLAPWTGIVWAGWSIGVEMLFYMVFPLVLLTIHSRNGMLTLVIVSILVSYASYEVLSEHYEITVARYGYNWAYFSFLPNLCFFAFGMYAYILFQTLSRENMAIRFLIPLGSGAMLLLLILTDIDEPLKSFSSADTIIWGASLAGICVWQATKPSLWSANRFMEYLGERSYSIYLLHPVVIYLLIPALRETHALLVPHFGNYAFFGCTLILLFPLLLLAEVSYRLIELPGVRLGRRISAQLLPTINTVPITAI